LSDTRPYDEQLPWLQPVEDEDEPRGLSARKMFAALLVVVLAAAIVAATFFWLGRRDTVVNGPPELIHAPPGPYKVKPENPGGLNISAESETAFETSSGEDRNAQLDTSKLPNPPALKPEADQPKTLPGNETKTPVPAVEEPKAKPTGGPGSVIQLGAFANRTQAERAWTALSTRFASIAALNKIIVPYSGGMRLRAGAASPADAKQACDMLKAAGESCFIAR
jgi:hypothetical protein